MLTTLTLAALLLAAPASSQSDCRSLERAARGIKLDYSQSTQNGMSCGTDGEYEASEYLLPTLADAPMEMHVIGVHRGSFPPGEEHTREHPRMMGVRVVVYKTELPALLVFTAYEDTVWDVILTQEARVERVVLQGRGEQSIKGIPDSIPVIRRRYADACGYAYGWEGVHNRLGGSYRLMIQGLRCATGLRETSFQGCYSGAVFEVPHRKAVTSKERWDPPCPLPSEPELSASGRRPGQGRQRGGPWPVRPSRAEAGPGSPQSPDPKKGMRLLFGGEEEQVPRLSADKESLPRPEGYAPRKEEPVTAEPERASPAEREPPAESLKRHDRYSKESLARPEAVPGREAIPVRALAILLEGRRELATHDAIPDLIEAMEKGDKLLRWRAADELGKMGPAAERAIGPLSRALKDREEDVRSSAALALGNIGPKSESAVKPLKKLLDDRSADVRYSARTALERIGTPKALKALGK